MGSLFTGLNVMEGARLTPQLAITNIGGLYVYQALLCPMEAISGRQSSLHNAISGGVLGYIGVASRQLSIPFVSPYFFHQNPQIPPPLMGAAVYGGMAFVLASFLGGKPL